MKYAITLLLFACLLVSCAEPKKNDIEAADSAADLADDQAVDVNDDTAETVHARGVAVDAAKDFVPMNQESFKVSAQMGISKVLESSFGYEELNDVEALSAERALLSAQPWVTESYLEVELIAIKAELGKRKKKKRQLAQLSEKLEIAVEDSRVWCTQVEKYKRNKWINGTTYKELQLLHDRVSSPYVRLRAKLRSVTNNKLRSDLSSKEVERLVDDLMTAYRSYESRMKVAYTSVENELLVLETKSDNEITGQAALASEAIDPLSFIGADNLLGIIKSGIKAMSVDWSTAQKFSSELRDWPLSKECSEH